MPGELTPLLEGERARAQARLAAARGEDGVDVGFAAAAAIFAEAGLVFRRAVTVLEHGEWLAAQGRIDEAAPLLAEAGETFARLEARPWLARLAAVSRPAVPA